MLSDDRWETVERVLTWVLAAALVASLIGVIYVATTPGGTTDPYTEFYILGPDGNASEYPTNLSVGESGTIIVGLTNHERREMQYTVALATNTSTVTTRTVTVPDEATWEDRFTFTPESPGRTRLRILLYRGDSANLAEEPYRRLRLWVNVRSPATS
jgi:uncharacterized membrane protein